VSYPSGLVLCRILAPRVACGRVRSRAVVRHGETSRVPRENCSPRSACEVIWRVGIPPCGVRVRWRHSPPSPLRHCPDSRPTKPQTRQSAVKAREIEGIAPFPGRSTPSSETDAPGLTFIFSPAAICPINRGSCDDTVCVRVRPSGAMTPTMVK
jgi:hypothetical protein